MVLGSSLEHFQPVLTRQNVKDFATCATGSSAAGMESGLQLACCSQFRKFFNAWHLEAICRPRL